MKPLEPGYEITYKLAGECVYLCLKMAFIVNIKDTPPPFAVEELLKATEKMIPPETRAWIGALIEMRMKDKTATYVTTPEFCEFVDDCLN